MRTFVAALRRMHVGDGGNPLARIFLLATCSWRGGVGAYFTATIAGRQRAPCAVFLIIAHRCFFLPANRAIWQQKPHLSSNVEHRTGGKTAAVKAATRRPHSEQQESIWGQADLRCGVVRLGAVQSAAGISVVAFATEAYMKRFTGFMLLIQL